jgi:hypothetical protein
MIHDTERVIKATRERFTMERPTDTPALGEVALSQLSGYDLVAPTDAAILHCGMLVHNTVMAMNTAHNESTVSWDLNRDSVLSGVRRTLENPSETPEENHAAWMEYKIREGWVYGIEKDPEAKTHPCLKPYEELDPFQRSKDLVFQAIVRTYFGEQHEGVQS